MDNNTVTILNEEFENDKTGEKVQGITIIVDGKLKEVVDLLMKNDSSYKNYTEIVRDAFFKGINSMIIEHQNNSQKMRDNKMAILVLTVLNTHAEIMFIGEQNPAIFKQK